MTTSVWIVSLRKCTWVISLCALVDFRQQQQMAGDETTHRISNFGLHLWIPCIYRMWPKKPHIYFKLVPSHRGEKEAKNWTSICKSENEALPLSISGSYYWIMQWLFKILVGFQHQALWPMASTWNSSLINLQLSDSPSQLGDQLQERTELGKMWEKGVLPFHPNFRNKARVEKQLAYTPGEGMCKKPSRYAHQFSCFLPSC